MMRFSKTRFSALIGLPSLALGVPVVLIGLGAVAEASVTPCAVFDTPFLHSASCSPCHANHPSASSMRDEKARPIAPFDLWRSSMMANAARDPLWRAQVSVEVAATPSRRGDIETKCMRCHAPMASVDGHGDTEYRAGLDLLDSNDPRSSHAIDGVSCTACHMIEDIALGQASSFSGHFHVNEAKKIYGPHGQLFSMPMVAQTGRTPAQASHTTKSELCATCHTLFTDALAADGVATGRKHAEQTPFLEWRNSIFAQQGTTQSCQDCHTPTRSIDDKTIATMIARRPNGRDWNLQNRSPYGRHVFVGGNTLLPAILRVNPTALRVAAPAAAFDATIAAARDQLRNKTARVTLPRVVRNGNNLEIDVAVENLCGHKFPTGFPSRRSYLQLRVLDPNRRVVFASGQVNAKGQLVDMSGKVLPEELVASPIQPHHDRITSARQVQIWEPVMQDSSGKTTWLLMRAAGYAKDNRILPKGWSATHRDAPATAPVGTAGDTNFVAGSDRVSYVVDAPLMSGDYTIEASLFYQVLGARYEAELLRTRTPEVLALESYLNRASRAPELVGTVTVLAK